jgi:hypothetical protein
MICMVRTLGAPVIEAAGNKRLHDSGQPRAGLSLNTGDHLPDGGVLVYLEEAGNAHAAGACYPANIITYHIYDH